MSGGQIILATIVLMLLFVWTAVMAGMWVGIAIRVATDFAS